MTHSDGRWRKNTRQDAASTILDVAHSDGRWRERAGTPALPGARHTVRFDDGRRERVEVSGPAGVVDSFGRQMLSGAVSAPVLPLRGRDRHDDLARRLAAAKREEEELRRCGAIY